MSTVLVVDDLAANREFLVTLLGYQGHRLLEAADGREGLALARAEHPDLVITDVLMPVMDGYEFVRELRLDPSTRSIPVVFATANYGEREARDFALASGVSFVLTKPIEPEEVLRIVARAIAGETEGGTLSGQAPITRDFDREHLRLVTDKLSVKTEDLRGANGRLRALVNIGLELASEREPDRLLQNVCVAARELFGATYVTLGIVSRIDRRVERLVTSGIDTPIGIITGDVAPGILAATINTRRTVRGDNAGGAPAGLSLPARHPPVRAFLAAPVASPAHVYGWIFLAGDEGRTFSEDDEQLVTALAGQVGRIYENGYFYALARSERDRAESYLNTAEVILLALDLTGRITQINRYACTLLGWKAEELIGRDWIDTCVPARMREFRRARLRDLAGGDPSIMENPVVTRTGEERLIEWRNTVMRDDEGNVIGTFSCGTDITENTRAEAQARLQSAALNAAANAIVITDRDGVIEWANPAFTELTGYSTAEAIGRNPGELVRSGEHRDSFYETMWDTIKSGRVWRGEMINRRKDGSLYFEEQAITPLRDAQGTIGHFIAVKQDITERRRAEEEIRQRSQLSLLTAGVGLALTQTDSLTDSLQGCADALVTHLGAALARIWTLDEATGGLELQASAGLYPRSHGSVPIGKAKLERITRDRKPQLTNSLIGDTEVSDREWARREGMVSFAGHPLMIGDRVVGVMTLFARHALQESAIAALASVADHIALGIERQRNASALRTAEERMRFALQSAGVGIWDLDYTTGVLQWSDLAQAQYGLQPGSFPGTFEAFIERVHPEDQLSAQQAIESALRKGGDFTTQHRTVWPDGTVHWLSGAGRVVLGEDGQPRRAIGISLDVTETHRLTEQFQQSQKMEAVGRLAGGVAHDFNNLLTAILGYCELLLSDIGPSDPRQADLREIHDAGQRAASLTRQLLAFSRKQIIAPTVLNLNRIVSDLQGMLTRLIGEDVGITTRLAPDLAPVKADRGQVEQVIMNLAVNARDAMPNGGALTIETANVELDEDYAAMHLAARPGLYVGLTMTDTGTGMTPEVQARLFEPFFTTKEPGKGTGLGMATVFGIVTQSGGTIGVYSEVGQGTSFKVYFPRADVGEVVEAPPLPVAPSTGAQTVLVVEDEEGLRALTRRLLERHGYVVLTAGSAEEALQVFRQNPTIDILLTDVVMPGASGPELTRRIMQERPGLMVIYMSGYTEDAIVRHGVLEPGIAFLNKPFTSDTLARKIEEVLNSGAKE